MNVPVQSRKPANPSFKRDLHYSSHQSPPGNLQDGMNFAGISSPTLQAVTQPVAVAPSINPQTQQHTHTSYLQQANNLGNPTSAAAYHLPSHGQTNSTVTALPLSSQGPTPSSTPPTVPNDQKGPNSFQQFTMNHLYRQVSQPTPYVVNTPNNSRTHTRGMTSLPSRTPYFVPLLGQPPVAPFSHHYIPVPVTASPLNPITGHGNFVTTPPTYPMSHGSSGSDHHQGMAYYQIQSQTGAGQSPSFTQNYIGRAAPWNGSTARPQPTVSGVPPTMLASPAVYGNIATNSTITQPLQQQQPPAVGKRKDRPRALRIIDPATNQEVDLGNQSASESSNEKKKESEDNRASKKLFQEEVKKLAAEPSSTSSDARVSAASSSLSSSSSPHANSEQAAAVVATTTATSSSSVPNGMAGATATTQQQQQTHISSPVATSSSDWKKTPSHNSNNNDSSSSNLNTISSENASAANSLPKAVQHAAGTHAAKLDFKRPTREDQNLVAAAAAIDANNGVSAATTTTTTTISSKKDENGKSPDASRAVASSKKITKESESAVSASVVGSLESSSAIPNAVPQVGSNRVDKVTSSLDIAESIPKAAATKQGTQDDAAVAHGVSTVAKLSMEAISKQASAAGATGLSLPATTTTTTTSSSSSSQSAAQTTTSKTDTKPQPPLVAKTTEKSQIAGSKTTSPVDEKASAKDDKSISSAAKVKSGGRGKEAANDAVEYPSKGGKSAQLSQKHHQDAAATASGVGKQTTMTTTSSAAAKQTNGESQDAQTISEGKSKTKSKKGSKKELNKKGQEKEGSDMDMFSGLDAMSPADATMTTTTTTTPAVTPKTHESATNKLPAATAQQGVVSDASRNARKINSSQKSTNEIKENANVVAAESPDKTDICPNIPAAAFSTPATRNLDITNKTEQMPTSDDKPTRRVYTIETLKLLREHPLSTQPVQFSSNLPHTFYADSRPRNNPQNGFSSSLFMPNFLNQSHSQSLRGSMVSTRKSQQGMKRDRPSAIHVSLSLRDDVQLRASKDAWRPAKQNTDLKSMSPEERQTQELLKTVRGILNKITPEKFETLTGKIKDLETSIDTLPRLQGVIDLIFQKAIDEPGFCMWYAKMCYTIQNISVPNEETPDRPITIRTQLINKCQKQFERDKAEELNAVKRQKEIEACPDPEKKKELLAEFEEMERRIRRQSVGNCRFIGELFKLNMLTAKIMLYCVNQLVAQIEEESLECLCKLLSTIGQSLESKVDKPTFDVIFNKMRDISEKKSYNVSSRIRFMLQDVIDLRRNNWKPRRDADNPKTLNQLNQEFEKAEMEAKMNAMMPRRYEDNNYNRNSRDHKKNNRNDNRMNDDGNWQMVSGKGSYQKTPATKVDRSKLEQLNQMNNAGFSSGEVALGPPSFSSWRSGSSTKGPEKKPNYSSFPSSVPPMKTPTMDRLTPSSSVERSKPPQMPREDNAAKMVRSSSSQNALPVPHAAPSTAAVTRNESPTTTRASTPAAVPLDPVIVERRCRVMIEELHVHRNADETVREFIVEFGSSSQIAQAVGEILSYVAESKPKVGNLCGVIFNKLLCKKAIALQHILDGLSNILKNADDIIIDCPKLWTFLAEILDPLFNEDCLSYSEFETAFVEKFPEQRNGHLLKAVSDKSPIVKKSLLIKRFETEDHDNIRKWIDANFEKARKNPQFVQTFTEAVCEYFRSDMGDDDEPPKYFIEKIAPLFRFYVENEADLELNCLVTVYKFAEKNEFPQGFLPLIFNALYISKSISSDAFMTWKRQGDDSSKPYPGAGRMSLKGFYESIEAET